MTANIDLRTTFNTQAELYHAIRPHYPEALFDALIETTQLSRTARLLEIGAGTGQATQSFARRGYVITAIELGDELAKVGQQALAQYPHIQYINAPFETVDVPTDYFDLVYVATAVHWIDPEYRFRKPHQILKAGGHMAIIGTVHISDEVGDAFFHASQPIYQKYESGKKSTVRIPHLSELQAYDVDENLFEAVYFNTFTHEVAYSASEYAQLLNTYSPTLAMDEASRTAFLQDIENLIRTQFNDHFLKHYAITLTVAKKKTT